MARRFSMIRDFHLADLFTLGNGACGAAAVFLAIDYASGGGTGSIYAAGATIAAALVFDMLDGRVARWRHRASEMGKELDSLADVISFGVAPAAVAYALGLRGALDVAALLFFVACGISRLARYNVTAAALASGGDKVAYFEGTPIPTSVLLVGVLVFLVWRGWVGDAFPGGTLPVLGSSFHPFVLGFVVSGSLMISKTIHIPKP